MTNYIQVKTYINSKNGEIVHFSRADTDDKIDTVLGAILKNRKTDDVTRVEMDAYYDK